MSTPSQQLKGVTEDEEEEIGGHREMLKDGDTPKKDSSVSADTKTTTSGKDGELQEDAGKTTSGAGTGGIHEIVFQRQCPLVVRRISQLGL